MSLPTRERELKHGRLDLLAGGTPSLPTRERELKQGSPAARAQALVSLPTRERELKREIEVSSLAAFQVAPYTGA